MTRTILLFLFLVTAAATADVDAQVVSPKEGPVRYGHHHLNVTSVAAHKKFWVDTLGGVPVKGGTLEGIKFPGGLILMRQQPPTGGSKGTTVNHVGFQVPNVHTIVEKLRAAGYPIITAAEVTSVKPEAVKDGVAYIPNQDANVVFTMGPDEMKVELFEVPTLTVPIALHHVHLAADKVEEVRDWYVKLFGATPARRGSYDTAELPGVSLRWTPSTPAPVGTKGRALDHIGFEVVGLKSFCKKLEGMGVSFDRPYSEISGANLAVAFLTDPSGTFIELTEGLDKF